jgi:cytochrome b561
MATGFHGFHVIIGTIFLTVCLFRALAGHFTPRQHFGFEAAAWYWHFVDVVWLFLFVCIYVWGSRGAASSCSPVMNWPLVPATCGLDPSIHGRDRTRSWVLASSAKDVTLREDH